MVEQALAIFATTSGMAQQVTMASAYMVVHAALEAIHTQAAMASS